VLLAGRYFAPTDIANLTDGEILDLVYHIVEDFKGPAQHSLDVITELLTLAKGGN
jgi:hypothetical protein